LRTGLCAGDEKMIEEGLEVTASGSRLRRVIIGGVVVLFLAVVFRHEIALLWQALWLPVRLLAGGTLPSSPAVDQILMVVGLVMLNLASIAALGAALLSWSGAVILPAGNWAEQKQAARLLWRFLRGRKPAVGFIREGQLTDGGSEAGEKQPRVLIVDLTSAAVIERELAAKRWLQPAGPQPAELSGKLTGRNGTAHVAGAGLVFLRRGEKLRQAVSLRKQARSLAGVRAYTSDGIEVETRVSVQFTLGQPPDVLKVAYVGYTQDDLRVLIVDETTRKIKAIADELDAEDKAEIHAFAQRFLMRGESVPQIEPTVRGDEHPPYVFEEEHILAAVYSQARRAGEDRLEAWTELPPRVAAEPFRNMLAQVTYDALYLPEDAENFPLQREFKPRFVHQMRMSGVMSYQFVHRLDGKFPAPDQRIEARSFRIAPVQELRNTRVLRDRGIKVTHASFSELQPVDPAIRQQRLENWRARWQRDTAIVRANQDLEAARVLNHARAEKQKEMITKLSDILQSSTYSEEALVLRIFQALEDVTTDPAARRILPRDTISMLSNLRLWLLPDSQVPTALLEERLEGDEK